MRRVSRKHSRCGQSWWNQHGTIKHLGLVKTSPVPTSGQKEGAITESRKEHLGIEDAANPGNLEGGILGFLLIQLSLAESNQKPEQGRHGYCSYRPVSGTESREDMGGHRTWKGPWKISLEKTGNVVSATMFLENQSMHLKLFSKVRCLRKRASERDNKGC